MTRESGGDAVKLLGREVMNCKQAGRKNKQKGADRGAGGII